LAVARAQFRKLGRRSVAKTLEAFKRAVEARAIDAMWRSRAKGKLRSRPETIAQGLLAVFVQKVLWNGGGFVLREMASGVGFVDVAIIFASAVHLVEMKVLKSGKLVGVSQLTSYMRTENRKQGWLVVFDARALKDRIELPSVISTDDGVVRLIVVDINPVAPSKVKPQKQKN
jgi:hypothetical protein